MPTLAMALPGLHDVRRGAETAIEALARALAGRPGWRVTLFGRGLARPGEPYDFEPVACPPFGAFVTRPSLPMLRTPAQWQELAFARALRRQMAGRRFDVTLACSWPWTHFVLRRCGTRHVFWTQNGDHMAAAGSKEYRLFGCDGLVCTNPDYYERHSSNWRCLLVPNGVDPDVFRPAGGVGRAGEARVALVVSALVAHKGVDRAVRSAASVPGLRLVVCGEGPEGEALDALAGQLMPGRYTRIRVERREMPDVYRSADVLIHPCETEPSANVWSEALASGLPVVAHDMPVTRWVLGRHGYLCDTRDLGALSASVAGALSAAGTLADRQARNDEARKRLAWGGVASKVAGFMESLLPRPAACEGGAAWADVGVVVIGRNEGERLSRCLRSIPIGAAAGVVYVDSDSSDDSVARAESTPGVEVVRLTRDRPLTAARARNAGWRHIASRCRRVGRVLFLDGDTELLSGYVLAATEAMSGDVVGVSGRRRERERGRSVYNRLCDMEWNTRSGVASALGGDAMYRLRTLEAVGGFDETLIAGEEPELAFRLRAAGLGELRRIPVDMTLHDAAMTRAGQWWRRQVRAGHAYAEGQWMHRPDGGQFRRREVRSIVTWGVVMPTVLVAMIACGVTLGMSTWVAWVVVGLAVGAWVVQAMRVALSRLYRGDGVGDSLSYGVATVLGKHAQCWGVMQFHVARMRGRRRGLIEYKAVGSSVRSARAGPDPAGGRIGGMS